MTLNKYIILFISAIVTITSGLHSKEMEKVAAIEPEISCSKSFVQLGTESEIPKNIDDPPWNNEVFPSKTYQYSEIIDKGIQITPDFAYNDPNWKRQAYKSYWHSSISGGRWSYVPTRIHYAMHRLFTTYPTASIYYDFIHDLGIADENNQFAMKYDGPYDYITTVVMKAQVQKILTYGNQVMIVVKPTRYGLQVLNIPVDKIKPENESENLLFQLVDEQGNELDYSLIVYVKPKHARPFIAPYR